jgi:transcription-repair coupling factor (superfamily II helicase)
MVGFVAHKFDVLVATTIVENGLDIPNANTIIVNRADRYGLAQLYQLRGRVGRSDRRAYAYLLIPPEQTLSPVARRRLAAIREFSDLGSGFRIAALDLEIRGAGNLLGGEQSGHIEAVGFDMYVKLLEDTIRELKGEDLEDERRAAVNLRLNLRIDEEYIPDMNQRLSAYRRLANARSLDEIDTLVAELRDRYGAVPASVGNLAEYSRIRLLADRIWLESVDREGQNVVLKFRQDAKLDPAMIPEARSESRRPHAASAGGSEAESRRACRPSGRFALTRERATRRCPVGPSVSGRIRPAGVPSHTSLWSRQFLVDGACLRRRVARVHERGDPRCGSAGSGESGRSVRQARGRTRPVEPDFDGRLKY